MDAPDPGTPDDVLTPVDRHLLILEETVLNQEAELVALREARGRVLAITTEDEAVSGNGSIDFGRGVAYALTMCQTILRSTLP